MKSSKNLIAVFATSVTKKRTAEMITKEIWLFDYVQTCNFDLDDCDKILRVESEVEIAQKVIQLLNEKGFNCVELLD